MAMPRPVPWMPLVVLSCTLEKGSKMCFWNSSLMPRPLSSTTSSKSCFLSCWLASSWRETLILPPFSVYLMALVIRLIKICFNWMLSPKTCLCSTSISKFSSWPLLFAKGCTMITDSCNSSVISILAFCRDILPLSIRLISSTWLISSAKWSEAVLILPKHSTSLSRLSRFILAISSIPIIPFKGVRTSWLMAERKARLAWLERWASSKESSSILRIVISSVQSVRQITYFPGSLLSSKE